LGLIGSAENLADLKQIHKLNESKIFKLAKKYSYPVLKISLILFLKKGGTYYMALPLHYAF